jgi:hypothetical protein
VPADTRVAGPAVGELFVVQNNLPAPLNTAGLAEQSAGALQCKALAAPAPPPVASAPPPEQAPAPSEVSGLSVTDNSGGDVNTSLGGSFAAPPLPASPPATIVAQAEPPTVPAVQVSGSGPGFAYPIILVLPLLLVALGGYLGWALTRPVAKSQP